MLPGAIIMPVSVAVAAFFIVPRDRLKIVNHKNGEYWIKGFSESFLDSLVTVDNWKRVVKGPVFAKLDAVDSSR